MALRMRSGSTSARPSQDSLTSAVSRSRSSGFDTPLSTTVIVVDFGLAALLRFLVRALLRAALAVEHVGAGDLVLAAAHQRELDLVLDFLDVDRAAFGLALHQRVDDGVGELHDFVAHARAGRALAAVDREERLGHRDRDLRRLEADHRAVAADHLVLRVAGVGGGHGASGFAGQEVTSGLGRRGGGSARELHGRVSCRNLVVVNAISGVFARYRRFRAMRGAMRVSGRRARISPLGAASGLA